MGGGGAIFNKNSSVSVTNCIFSENRSVMCSGGAIHNDGSSITIKNSTFSDNDAYVESSGGAIWSGLVFGTESPSAIITNCIFSGNRANRGGAINATNSTITNCTFIKNLAFGEDESSGGAISASNSTITNCILWANKSPDGSQIVGEASTVVNYSNIEGGYTGEGNIDADPLFVDSGYWDDNGTPTDFDDDLFVVGDYHLLADSPCIDAGTSQNAPSTDIDGDPRPEGAGYDIGVYEYDGCPNDPEKAEPGICGCGVPDTDSEKDGMPDCWEEKYGLNPSVDDANKDLDGDGFTNLIEYNRDTDPSDPNSHPSKAMPWLPLLLLDD
jgi:predicted outer membrane repeat protein